MYISKTLKDLRAKIRDWRSEGLSIGFVPTMGNLHQGHLSLVKLAKKQADKVVVSIFVNPMQFGPHEDFDRYPRTFEADCNQLAVEGTDMVFAPPTNEMYPNGVIQTRVCVPPALTELLEGASRPGHFDGVTTIVHKLFNMVQPDLAVFGQKDFQQWRVIDQMVKDMGLPVKIVKAPIVRASDGLALSSRNQYLDTKQRQIAPGLYQEVKTLAEHIKSDFDCLDELENQAVQNLLKRGFNQVDYVKVVDVETLVRPEADSQNLVVLVVARLGSTRLLDNCLLSI